MIHTIKNPYGLEYVTIKLETPGENIPARLLAAVEQDIARMLIEHRHPLRGYEMRFIRKALGLTLEQVGNYLGIDRSNVMRIEKRTSLRIDTAYEVTFRVAMAEQLGIKLPGKYSELIGKDEHEKIVLKKAC